MKLTQENGEPKVRTVSKYYPDFSSDRPMKPIRTLIRVARLLNEIRREYRPQKSYCWGNTRRISEIKYTKSCNFSRWNNVYQNFGSSHASNSDGHRFESWPVLCASWTDFWWFICLYRHLLRSHLK